MKCVHKKCKPRFTHYSQHPQLTLDKLKDTPFKNINGICNFKPVGLWVSHDDEDGWLNWCDKNEYSAGKYRYELEIRDAGLFWITDKRQLIEFHNLYKTLMSNRIENYYVIDWSKLFHDYNGIMIFPYIYEMRLDLHTPWYYPWDCASGCIWRPSQVVKYMERKDSDGQI